MDSSRGGLLANFILILPLIIVPALAMLRSADRDAGYVSEDVAGADDFSDFDVGDSPVDEFADLFDTPRDSSSDNRSTASESSLSAANPFPPGRTSREPGSGLLSPGQSAPNQNRSEETPSGRPGTLDHPDGHSHDHDVDNHDADALLDELTDLGVTRTLWFAPGRSQRVGFAAFVPTSGGIVHFRFESIADSRSAAIQDVARQILKWRQKQPRQSHP